MCWSSFTHLLWCSCMLRCHGDALNQQVCATASKRTTSDTFLQAAVSYRPFYPSHTSLLTDSKIGRFYKQCQIDDIVFATEILRSIHECISKCNRVVWSKSIETTTSSDERWLPDFSTSWQHHRRLCWKFLLYVFVHARRHASIYNHYTQPLSGKSPTQTQFIESPWLCFLKSSLAGEDWLRDCCLVCSQVTKWFLSSY